MNTQQKKMGAGIATIMALNAMTGASIFIIPEPLQRIVGPAGILAYLLVTASVWCVAYSLGRISSHYPAGGSFYTYISSWAGRKTGLGATLLYCTGLIFSLGLSTRMTGIYLNGEIPAISVASFTASLLILLILSLFAGAKSIRRSQIVLFILTIAPLGIITTLCLSRAHISNLLPFMPHGFTSVLSATRIIIFGFFGFESVTTLHALVEKPEKTVPRAITLSTLVTGGLYTGFIAALFLGIPQKLFTLNATLPQILHSAFPSQSWLIILITWGIIITITGTMHSLLWGVSNLIQSIPKLFNIRNTSGQIFVLGSRSALVLVGLLAWLCSVIFTQPIMFFSIIALCVIPVLAASIIPCTLKRISAKAGDRIITFIGLATLAVMFFYAGHDVFHTFFG